MASTAVPQPRSSTAVFRWSAREGVELARRAAQRSCRDGRLPKALDGLDQHMAPGLPDPARVMAAMDEKRPASNGDRSRRTLRPSRSPQLRDRDPPRAKNVREKRLAPPRRGRRRNRSPTSQRPRAVFQPKTAHAGVGAGSSSSSASRRPRAPVSASEGVRAVQVGHGRVHPASVCARPLTHGPPPRDKHPHGGVPALRPQWPIKGKVTPVTADPANSRPGSSPDTAGDSPRRNRRAAPRRSRA